MKETIIILTIILATCAFAALCGTQTNYATSTSTYSPEIISSYAGQDNGTATDGSLTKGTTVSLTNASVSWYGGCYNNVETGTFFDGYFGKNSESFWQHNDQWVDSYKNGDKIVHLYSNSTSFVIVLMDSNGQVTASRRYTGTVTVKTVAICDDGRIYVAGISGSSGYIGIFTQNGNDFNIISSARYTARDTTTIEDSACDDKADVGAFTGWTSYLEEDIPPAFLMTVDNDGDPLDFDTVYDQVNFMTPDLHIDLYERGSLDTQLYFAGITDSNPDNILFAGFNITAAGLINTPDFLKKADQSSLEYLSIQNIKTQTNGKFYITFTADYNGNTTAGIMKVDTTGFAEASKTINVNNTYPVDLTISNGTKAAFTIAGNIIAQLNADNSLNTWTLTGADTISIGPIAQYYDQSGDGYLAIGYTIQGNTYPHVALLFNSNKNVVSSKRLTNTQGAITNTVKDIIYRDANPNDWVIEIATNQGGGFQDFGNGEEPGPTSIPEFGTGTLLLAILSAGLVLFFIRQNRYLYK